MDNGFNVIAIGASLGGIRALSVILERLPIDFPAPIVVAQHRHPKSRFLDKVLNYNSMLPVKEVEGDEIMREGTVYIAPPDYHLLVEAGCLKLSSGPKINFTRPSVDVLFESVAKYAGEQAIGVILTGKMSDGAKGAQMIQHGGGRVIVQDRDSAEAFDMPRAAIRAGAAHFVLPIEHIAAALVTLVMVKGAESLFSGSMPIII